MAAALADGQRQRQGHDGTADGPTVSPTPMHGGTGTRPPPATTHPEQEQQELELEEQEQPKLSAPSPPDGAESSSAAAAVAPPVSRPAGATTGLGLHVESSSRTGFIHHPRAHIVTASSNTQPLWERLYLNCGCCLLRPTHVARGLLVLFIVLVLVGLPLWIWDQYFVRGTERHVLAWAVGAVFAALACLISLVTIFEHMAHYNRPELQRYIIRILWMVPIYAVESYLSLRFKEAALYLETAREWYEAYVIYCFLYLLLFYCAGSYDLTQFTTILSQRPQHDARHLFPFTCLPEWKMGPQFLRNCRIGVLQYVVIRSVCTGVTFILGFFGRYCEGEITEFHCGYIYMLIIVNFSQIWAMYCLILFYHACINDLQGLRPFPKFLAIKAVVFFSFWQGVVVAAAVQAEVIKATQTYTVEEIAKGFQDLLIVVEMFIVAVAHHWVFAYKDVADIPTDLGSCFRAFKQSALPTDIMRDAAHAGAHTAPLGRRSVTVARPPPAASGAAPAMSPTIVVAPVQPVDQTTMDGADAASLAEQGRADELMLTSVSDVGAEGKPAGDAHSASGRSARVSPQPSQIAHRDSAESSPSTTAPSRVSLQSHSPTPADGDVEEIQV